MSLQQVHLRITDAATEQPTPVRLRITDAAGTYYAPFGRLTEFATGVNEDVGGNVMIGFREWCYIDGTCEILLPPGQLHVEITKGPEYLPINEDVTLLSGKMSLRFTIERWIDMRKRGWYSGDTRAHFLSPDAALLEGQAEDIAVVNLLACETQITQQVGQLRRKAIPNILAFSGQSFAREVPGCGVAVNTHNRHWGLGSLGLLHCHRVVYPLTAESNDWTLDDWCGQCHRKNGLVIWTRLWSRPFNGPLVSMISGNIDALELNWFDESDPDLCYYYRLFDAGFHLPLVGASGKEENLGELGSMRTYAFIGVNNSFSYSNWIEAVRLGKTFISNGPLLRFAVERAEHGGAMVHAEASSLVPYSALELMGNGEIIASAAPGPDLHAAVHLDLPASFEGWVALRCRGSPTTKLRDAAFAHSSPVSILGDGQPSQRRIKAIKTLLEELEDMEMSAREKSYGRFVHELESARTVLAKKLS